MNKTGNKGIKRILNACVYSAKGFRETYRTEEAFRQEIWASIVLIPLSFFVANTVIEWILLVGSLLLVLVVEILNSSIEAVVDRIGTEHHELSGKAKDAGSAAVTVAIIIAMITWLGILIS